MKKQMDTICFLCGKPVYHAERRTSMGKQWHRQCLCCQECGKVLHPGQHAEHHGLPYCHIPCYKALFGPTLTGYGIGAFAHSQFGAAKSRKSIDNALQRRDLIDRVRQFNVRAMSNSAMFLSFKEVNGRIVVSGLLRVYWRVQRTLQLSNDESLITALDDARDQNIVQTPPQLAKVELRHPRVLHRGTLSAPRGSTLRKRQSINGHTFVGPSSLQMPQDTSSAIRVTSEESTRHVIALLLAKFKLEESNQEFTLHLLTADGGDRKLGRGESPLLEWLNVGPNEQQAKLILREKYATAVDSGFTDTATSPSLQNQQLSEDVQRLASLPESLLYQMLRFLDEEETRERMVIEDRFQQLRISVSQRLLEEQRVATLKERC